MIVTFDPCIGTTNPDINARYMNFLRCVTAAATAAAGTTTLTVNPWTSSSAIDATKNCIISVDANTEAGGWTTSTGTVPHNVINSGSFTAISSAGAYNVASSYKADFYNASGKSAVPYNKMTFHIPVTNTYDTSGYAGPVMPGAWSSHPYVQVTFGCSTTIDFSDTGYVPSNATTNQYNTRSSTINKDISTTSAPYYIYSASVIPRMDYMSQNNCKFRIAVTANYCIIWTERYDSTYAGGYHVNQTSHNPGFSPYGAIMYMGLRETQPWENSLNFNPPWVTWSWLNNAQTSGSSYAGYGSNHVRAFMAGIDNAGGVATSASVRDVTNNYQNAVFNDGSFDSGNALQTPIFFPRRWDGTTSTSQLRGGTTSNIQYPPQADTSTGVQVPGAYPIVIRAKTSGNWNPGGQCRGIYKSISMPWTTQKLYWTAANQTFTINGENYIPVVFNEEMFLIRNI